MAKLKTMNLKLGGSEKLNETSARDLLMALKGAGGGMLYEIKKQIHSKIGAGERFFLVKVESGVGGPLAAQPASQLQTSINNEFKKTDYPYRVRYSDEKAGLIVVPEDKYTQIFGKREKALA